MIDEQPDTVSFPRLTADQLARVDELGERATFRDGEALFRSGDRDFPFFVVDRGRVEILDESGDEPRHVTYHGPGEFTGDVDLLTGRPALVSAFARGVVEALRVEASALRSLLNDVPTLSDLLLDAFQSRRAMLERQDVVGVRVVGSGHCAEANLLREFLYKNKVPFTFVDADSDETLAWREQRGVASADLPALVCSEAIVSRPALAEVAQYIGIRREVGEQEFDLVIVGAGPAGLAAAVYGASEGLSTLLLDGLGPGGQAGASSKIENYMGFPAGLSGVELANKGYLQALKFGAQFSAPVRVRGIETLEGGLHALSLDTDERVYAGAVLVATGASYRHLEAEGCERFRNAGLFQAATSVEARLCAGRTAVVIGGGNSAGQAALHLSERAERVVILLRSGELTKSMSDYLTHRILAASNVEIWPHFELESVEGDTRLRSIRVASNRDGERRDLECAAVFSFIGARPNTGWLPERVARDERGFVLTGGDVGDRRDWPLEREPCQLETSVPGVFAAGDARHGSTKRVAFAVGDGALAVTCVHSARQRS